MKKHPANGLLRGLPARSLPIMLAMASPLPAAEMAAAAARPNILIIYTDDLGYGDPGCYNRESKIPTPNIDRLASEGMRFTDGHSSSGVCSPSRYALLTGRYHWRSIHGITAPMGPSAFKDDEFTLPGMLKANGYSTAIIGKWHLGFDWKAIRKPDAKPIDDRHGSGNIWGPESHEWLKDVPGGPLAHGFDHFFGLDAIFYPPYCWIQDRRVVGVPDAMLDNGSPLTKAAKEGNAELRPGPIVTGWDLTQVLPTITRHGVEYLRSRKDNGSPFFLYFSFCSPHAPIVPNREFTGASAAGPYGDFVCETDHAIGQLLQALEDSGHTKDTVVVFSSDNGAEKFAYARDAKYGHWSSSPLRGVKRDTYEGGHRVPFIVKWPGVTKAGSVSAGLACQIDLTATFAAAIGYDLPAHAAEDSYDLLPQLKGAVPSVRDTLVHNTRKDSFAIRCGDWLLVDNTTGYDSAQNRDLAWEAQHGYAPDEKGPVQLFELQADLPQRRNVAAAHPEKVAEMQALLKKIRNQGHSAPRLEGGAKP